MKINGTLAAAALALTAIVVVSRPSSPQDAKQAQPEASAGYQWHLPKGFPQAPCPCR